MELSLLMGNLGVERRLQCLDQKNLFQMNWRESYQGQASMNNHKPMQRHLITHHRHIFDHIESDEQMSYAIKCSFLEIYKENIRDLLAPNTSTGINKENIYLKIRESPTKGVWVEGLTEEFATCEQGIS